ncbi:hypothetical protein GW17_00054381 [Ensete ventricosum]|nr:hypothetical protein GW17_00054381 [Ensete ventricosum]
MPANTVRRTVAPGNASWWAVEPQTLLVCSWTVSTGRRRIFRGASGCQIHQLEPFASLESTSLESLRRSHLDLFLQSPRRVELWVAYTSGKRNCCRHRNLPIPVPEEEQWLSWAPPGISAHGWFYRDKKRVNTRFVCRLPAEQVGPHVSGPPPPPPLDLT